MRIGWFILLLCLGLPDASSGGGTTGGQPPGRGGTAVTGTATVQGTEEVPQEWIEEILENQEMLESMEFFEEIDLFQEPDLFSPHDF